MSQDLTEEDKSSLSEIFTAVLRPLVNDPEEFEVDVEQKHPQLLSYRFSSVRNHATDKGYSCSDTISLRMSWNADSTEIKRPVVEALRKGIQEKTHVWTGYGENSIVFFGPSDEFLKSITSPDDLNGLLIGRLSEVIDKLDEEEVARYKSKLDMS